MKWYIKWDWFLVSPKSSIASKLKQNELWDYFTEDIAGIQSSLYIILDYGLKVLTSNEQTMWTARNLISGQ